MSAFPPAPGKVGYRYRRRAVDPVRAGHGGRGAAGHALFEIRPSSPVCAAAVLRRDCFAGLARFGAGGAGHLQRLAAADHPPDPGAGGGGQGRFRARRLFPPRAEVQRGRDRFADRRLQRDAGAHRGADRGAAPETRRSALSWRPSWNPPTMRSSAKTWRARWSVGTPARSGCSAIRRRRCSASPSRGSRHPTGPRRKRTSWKRPGGAEPGTTRRCASARTAGPSSSR